MIVKDGIIYINDHPITFNNTFEEIEIGICKNIYGKFNLDVVNSLIPITLTDIDFFGLPVECKLYFNTKKLKLITLVFKEKITVDNVKYLDQQLEIMNKDQLSVIYRSGKIHIIIVTDYSHKHYTALIEPGF